MGMPEFDQISYTKYPKGKGRTIRNPGRGVKIPKKNFLQRKMPGKKIRAAITSEKKNSCKQTAKYK
jgi:hypothetical protein